MRQPATSKGQGNRRTKFVSDIIAELRKVVWPTRQEATYLTTIVIIVTIVVAIALWVIDMGFSELMNLILFQ